jgi:hypothetical protein
MIELWHGGKRWDGRPEVRPSKQGRYECGPGIYLSTNYSTARKYATGGKVVTRVSLADNIGWLERTKLPLKELLHYLDTAPRLPRREAVKRDFLERQDRRSLAPNDLCDVARLVNTLINEELLAGKLGVHLAEWLTSKGIDASLHSPRVGEQWVIVFNPAAIKKHTATSPSSVALADYELPFIELPDRA